VSRREEAGQWENLLHLWAHSAGGYLRQTHAINFLISHVKQHYLCHEGRGGRDSGKQVREGEGGGRRKEGGNIARWCEEAWGEEEEERKRREGQGRQRTFLKGERRNMQ